MKLKNRPSLIFAHSPLLYLYHMYPLFGAMRKELPAYQNGAVGKVRWTHRAV